MNFYKDEFYDFMCYSLYNIANDLAHSDNPNDIEVQEEICNRYGRSLDSLTDSEKEYIEQTITEF